MGLLGKKKHGGRGTPDPLAVRKNVRRRQQEEAELPKAFLRDKLIPAIDKGLRMLEKGEQGQVPIDRHFEVNVASSYVVCLCVEGSGHNQSVASIYRERGYSVKLGKSSKKGFNAVTLS